MIVVADTSPFIVLISIGFIDVLPTLFGRVVIPPEGAAEFRSPRRSEAVQSFAASPPHWLDVRSPSNVEDMPQLDAGEAAAIQLAPELRADQLIIDETLGRHAALARNLRVIGTVGVLEIAAEMGVLELQEAFARIKNTDFWVSAKFLDERLALFLQRKQVE
jgi:predicted nucleic acid-binding protein